MDCISGGAVTFTRAEPGYRLRIATESQTVSIFLTTEESAQLSRRIIEIIETNDD